MPPSNPQPRSILEDNSTTIRATRVVDDTEGRPTTETKPPTQKVFEWLASNGTEGMNINVELNSPVFLLYGSQHFDDVVGASPRVSDATAAQPSIVLHPPPPLTTTVNDRPTRAPSERSPLGLYCTYAASSSSSSSDEWEPYIPKESQCTLGPKNTASGVDSDDDDELTKEEMEAVRQRAIRAAETALNDLIGLSHDSDSEPDFDAPSPTPFVPVRFQELSVLDDAPATTEERSQTSEPADEATASRMMSHGTADSHSISSTSVHTDEGVINCVRINCTRDRRRHGRDHFEAVTIPGTSLVLDEPVSTISMLVGHSFNVIKLPDETAAAENLVQFNDAGGENKPVGLLMIGMDPNSASWGSIPEMWAGENAGTVLVVGENGNVDVTPEEVELVCGFCEEVVLPMLEDDARPDHFLSQICPQKFDEWMSSHEWAQSTTTETDEDDEW